tara:strand:- start:417 stop:521 length:105 start_codon:yes stop_codon:yes gene_type:complete
MTAELEELIERLESLEANAGETLDQGPALGESRS